MNIRCLLGRHKPINDLSDWRHGYYLSACADCGTPMRYYGGHWEAHRTRRKSGQDPG